MNLEKPDLQINYSGTSIAGTSLTGYITATRNRIESVLGDPLEHNSDEVTYMWIVEFYDGTVATIYNYEGETIEGDQLFKWHVGSIEKRGFELIVNTLLVDAGMQISLRNL